MRFRRWMTVSLMCLLLFGGVGGVSAREILDGEQCFVPENSTISGNVFVLCGELLVDGHIEGHLIGAARTATINGRVDGSIYMLGGQLDIYGEVGKDVHFGGIVLNVHASAQFSDHGGIIAANLSTAIDPEATIPGSIINLGYQLVIDGNVNREISFWGSSLTIAGEVQGNVYATVGDSESDGVSSEIETLLIPFPFDVELIDPGLIVADTGIIRGQLNYRGPTEGRLRGTLDQPEIFVATREPITIGGTTEQTRRGLQIYFQHVLDEFITLAFIGLVSLVIAPRTMQMPLRPLQARPLSTLGVGMLSFILSFPIVLIIILFSLLIVFIMGLLPLDDLVLVGGVVLGLANIGGAGLFYFTAIYVARVIVALAVGKLLLRLFWKDDGSMRSLFISMGIGLLLLSMLGSIPVFGWAFNALALFLGLGAILTVIRAQFRRFREAGAPLPPPLPLHYADELPALPYFPEDAQRFAPPLIDDLPQPMGLDNLPAGFRWWKDDE